MTTRIRILLALLGCLLFGAQALDAAPGHCDPLCCDEPCESGPLAPPSDCQCCAVRSATDTDPVLPSPAPPAPPAPQPALLAAPADLAVTAAAAQSLSPSATTHSVSPEPQRTVLRL